MRCVRQQILSKCAPSILNTESIAKASTNIDWEVALNAGQAAIIKKIYQQGHPTSYLILDSLENAVNKDRFSIIKDSTLLKNSIAFGKNIANQIYEWSKNDGGHLRYLENIDTKYVYHFGAGY